MQISGPSQPTTPRPQPAPASTAPEMSIAPSRYYRPILEGKLKSRMAVDIKDLLKGPGIPLGAFDGKGQLDIYRDPHEAPVSRGVTFDGSTAHISNVPAPGTDGAWDPYAYMPRFAFHPDEDAYPVDPAFDGDGNLENNAPAKPNGKDGNYRDGVIGGRQGLNAGFAVSQKGDYTVLTYSFFYPTNKAADYHTKDWSIAQVYLKPDKDGKLEPAYLYTSWHHGGVLTAWDDLRKDAQGRPVVMVDLGSHALQPVGKHQSLPKQGLQLRGDGQAELNGKVLPERLNLDTFQDNVANARVLTPDQVSYQPRLSTMRYGQVGFDPLLPEAFETHGGLKEAAKDKAEPVLDSAKDQLAEWGGKTRRFLKGLFD
ncbi:MAG TPA: hypothetical protein V6D05_09185 [Stenomitos sp.]